MEKEIPAVVPDFKLRPAPTETTKSQSNTKRVKRFITDLLSLGIQGFSAFYQNRKQNKLKKGMQKLFEKQIRLDNRVSRLVIGWVLWYPAYAVGKWVCSMIMGRCTCL